MYWRAFDTGEQEHGESISNLEHINSGWLCLEQDHIT